MKTNLILMVFLCGVYLYAEAQISYGTGTPVYTCNGSSITTLVSNREFTSAEKAAARAVVLTGTLSYLGIPVQI